MAAIQFYHLTATPLERALPKLLEKALAGGFKILLVAESEMRMEQLSQALWTFDPNSFLPHGSVKEGNVERQPVLLATELAPANGAKLLVVTDGREVADSSSFERVLDIFNGNDADAVENARARWKSYKDNGHAISYLRQSDSGGWEKAA